MYQLNSILLTDKSCQKNEWIKIGYDDGKIISLTDFDPEKIQSDVRNEIETNNNADEFISVEDFIAVKTAEVEDGKIQLKDVITTVNPFQEHINNCYRKAGFVIPIKTPQDKDKNKILIEESDIDLVVSQTGFTRTLAFKALKKCKGEFVDSIMMLITTDKPICSSADDVPDLIEGTIEDFDDFEITI